MLKDVRANPEATAILSDMLGVRIPHVAVPAVNTALKAEGRQPVHNVTDNPHPICPFAYAIKIPLCDVSIETGRTEMRVGSQRDSNVDQHETSGPDPYGLMVKHHVRAERGKHSPPLQPSTKKGSLILRDLRLWHAGMPHITEKPRMMLAFVIQPRWLLAPSTVLVPVGGGRAGGRAEGLVEQWTAEMGLEYAVRWV